MDGIYSYTIYLDQVSGSGNPRWSMGRHFKRPDECALDSEWNNYFFEVDEDDVGNGETVAITMLWRWLRHMQPMR